MDECKPCPPESETTMLAQLVATGKSISENLQLNEEMKSNLVNQKKAMEIAEETFTKVSETYARIIDPLKAAASAASLGFEKAKWDIKQIETVL